MRGEAKCDVGTVFKLNSEAVFDDYYFPKKSGKERHVFILPHGRTYEIDATLAHQTVPFLGGTKCLFLLFFVFFPVVQRESYGSQKQEIGF